MSRPATARPQYRSDRAFYAVIGHHPTGWYRGMHFKDTDQLFVSSAGRLCLDVYKARLITDENVAAAELDRAVRVWPECRWDVGQIRDFA